MGAGSLTALATLAVALLLDVLVGEYPRRQHPVVWVGGLISGLLKLAPRQGWWRQFLFGLFLAAGVTALCAAAARLALLFAATLPVLQLALGPVLQVALGAFLLKASFALRELGSAAARVRRRVEAGDLPGAREALRSLCSRDPSGLDAEALLAGTVESLAENASDSFVAPLLYFLLLGVPGAVAYRAINTLDAMVGYRGQYEALGKASARLDDLVNWVPARLTAGLLLLAGGLTGKSVREGWRVLRRDGAKTPSPNGGRPMAVMAGLLGVELEKKGVYLLGDRRHALSPGAAREAWRLVVLAGWMAAGLCALGVVGMNHLCRALLSC
jgi:adenosylcobinamide-phosphate synthase